MDQKSLPCLTCKATIQLEEAGISFVTSRVKDKRRQLVGASEPLPFGEGK